MTVTLLMIFLVHVNTQLSFELVQKIEVSNFEEFYGLTQDLNKKSETCYILFYESRQ